LLRPGIPVKFTGLSRRVHRALRRRIPVPRRRAAGGQQSL